MNPLLLAIFAIAAHAADPQADYLRGIDASRSGAHDEAVGAFTAALDSGGRHPAVYHGLGNALWRLDEPGPAIAAWRRGARLEPQNGDIEANLDRARAASIDRLDPPTGASSAFFWLSLLSIRGTAVLASVLLSLGLAAPAVRRLRRGRFSIGAESLVAVAVATVLAGSVRAASTAQDSVVIIVPEVSARSALGPDGVELFRLHEGAEVHVEETHRDHHLVELPDSRRGWVPAAATLSTDPSAPFVISTNRAPAKAP